MINQNKKKEPWRILVGFLSIAFIVYMFVKKDIITIYATAPSEQILPLVVTTIGVSLIKVAAIAGGVLLIKWMIRKAKKQVSIPRFLER